MSLNTNFGLDGATPSKLQDPDHPFSVIQGSQAGIVCLQEVLYSNAWTHYLSDLMKKQFWEIFWPHTTAYYGSHGNAILIHKDLWAEIISTRVHYLSRSKLHENYPLLDITGNRDRRVYEQIRDDRYGTSAAEVVIEFNWRIFTLLSVQWPISMGLQGEDSDLHRRASDKMAKLISEAAGTVIMAGDLNEISSWLWIQRLRWKPEPWVGTLDFVEISDGTLSSQHPLVRKWILWPDTQLDYLALGWQNSCDITDVQTHEAGSDHLGVSAKIRLFK